MSKLNQQYFETRQKHKESYDRKGYRVWILIALGVVAFFVVGSFWARQQQEEEMAEVVKQLREQGTLTMSDTLFVSKATGVTFIVPSHTQYREFNNAFVGSPADGNGITILVKRIMSDADYPSGMQQVQQQIFAGNKFSFQNPLRMDTANLIVESADLSFVESDNRAISAKVWVTRKGGLLYLLAIMSEANTWEGLHSEVERVRRSFQVVE